MSLREGKDTSCVRLGTRSRRKTEENVFLQRDCIQSLKTVIWDMNSLHGLSSVAGDNVMQQRRLASLGAVSERLWRWVSPHHTRTHLRCHKARLLQVCGRGGFAPSSSESVRWMLSFTAVVWGPVQAATMTCPFTGIVVPSHSVSETRGKVFKLDLKNKDIKKCYCLLHWLQPSKSQTCWIRLCSIKRTRAYMLVPIWAIHTTQYSSWLTSILTVRVRSNTSSVHVPVCACTRARVAVMYVWAQVRARVHLLGERRLGLIEWKTGVRKTS